MDIIKLALLVISICAALTVGCTETSTTNNDTASPPPTTSNTVTNAATTNQTTAITSTAINDPPKMNNPAGSNNSNLDTRESAAGRTREEQQQKSQLGEQRPGQTQHQLGSGANDFWIWTSTRAALVAAEDLQNSNINVDVRGSIVTLTGTVADAKQKTRAAQIARDTEGVKNVKNLLRIGATE